MTKRLEPPEAMWRRVSPKLITVRVSGTVAAGAVLTAATVPLIVLGRPWAPWLCAALVVATVLAVALIPRRVRAIGYQFREDDLLYRRGILFQRFVAVPYGRMQLVDVNRGPISRWAGLSELKLITAAAASGVTIPGLPMAEADELRDRIVELAESRRVGL